MAKKNLPPLEEIPANVPAKYIKDKDVDKDLEVFACLDAPYVVDGFSMRTPSLGVFSLIETFDCKFFGDPANCRLEDVFRFLYINHYRQECVAEVLGWIQEMGREYIREDLPDDQSEWHDWDRKVIEWGGELPFARPLMVNQSDEEKERLANAIEEINKWLSLSFTGFEMIPPSTGGGDSHIFGAVSMGSLISGVGKFMNVDYSTLIWDTPYSLVGHVVAQTCRNNGAEGVNRPKDKEDIKKQLHNSKVIQREGKLLPWQIEHPHDHGLSAFQLEWFPHLEKELDRLRENTPKVLSTEAR